MVLPPFLQYIRYRLQYRLWEALHNILCVFTEYILYM